MKAILRNTRKAVAMLLMAALVVGFMPTNVSATGVTPRITWVWQVRFLYAEPGSVIYTGHAGIYGLACGGQFNLVLTHNGEHVQTGRTNVFNSYSGFYIPDSFRGVAGTYVFTLIPPEGWAIADGHPPSTTDMIFIRGDRYQGSGWLREDVPSTSVTASRDSVTFNWNGLADFRAITTWYLAPAGMTQQPATAPNLATASDWAHQGITSAIEHGLVPENLQNNYTQPATRAEFTALAVALYEAATGRTIIGRARFVDTDDTNVEKMAYLGVVSGIGEGRFNPDGQITREQAAVMLSRLATAIGQPFPDQVPTFVDIASLSAWAIDGVGQAQAAGVMGGVGDNRFAPQDTFTREQSIITILRMFDMLS